MEHRPLAEPVGLDPNRWKPSARHRLFARLRMFRWLVVAVAGRSPAPRMWATEDIGLARLAYRVRAWWRWAAALPLPAATCFGLYFLGWRLVPMTTNVDGLLRAVLPAASLTSGLLAAGLMSATAQTKELRRRRVEALRECQRELQPIRRAFDMLETNFNNRTNKGEHLTRFLECVHRVGFEWSVYDGSDTGGRLIGVQKISDIVDALEQLSGTLTRPKHYRYLVEELGGGPAAGVTSLHDVVLATWPGVMNAVERIRPEAAATGSWQSLSFWEDLINDTLELASRARELSIEIHHQNLTRLRAMFAHLAWLIVVGVAVPLVALAFPAIPASKRGLTLVAVGGMLTVLGSTLVLLYRWITNVGCTMRAGSKSKRAGPSRTGHAGHARAR